METIRETIINERKGMKLTQAELAEKVGVRQATISDFESGKRSISSDTLEKIFDVLELKIPRTQSFVEFQWEASKSVAKTLSDKGLNPDNMGKDEMYQVTGNDSFLGLKEYSKDVYNDCVEKKLINEHDTFNYFKTLVDFHYTVIQKKQEGK